ncbi:cysteine peptidase family C39 domain-containing protein [Burkholderia sp. F1]|uniref:cysteine peptidase family C39 domain-containing protein n=1 Tax=Burkholderia sp. F1 TaxID=3366817 RepID=UPI003D71B288
MHTSERIFTGFRRKLPVVLQAEAAECGLACIAMIAEFHGFHTDMRLLRRKFPISLKESLINRPSCEVVGGAGTEFPDAEVKRRQFR